MGSAIDLRGKRFGKVLAIKPTSKRKANGEVIWECRCDCGKTFMQEPEHCDMEQHKAVDVLTMITQSIIHQQKNTEEAAKSACTECGEE